MSIRIETLEQLQDPKILENVLDRLRRTTRPRPFAFKKRCKALGDIPLLLTAPPGRKIKSSLLRSLRLGTPTQKGVVHREGPRLIFTFTKPVNASDTARWIAKCMHNAKSPVPLKCIEIRQPNSTTVSASTDTSTQTDPLSPSSELDAAGRTLEMDIPFLESIDEELPPIDEAFDDPEMPNADHLSASPDIEQLLIEHTSSKKIRWLTETGITIQEMEEDINQLTTQIESIEDILYTLETDLEALESIVQLNPPTPTENNPWQLLFETCQETNWTLDEIRTCLDNATVPTTPLLKELQFLSDDDEMKAFTLVRTYCREQEALWIQSAQPTKWKEARVQHAEYTALHAERSTEMESLQAQLTDMETKQEALLRKHTSRRLDVYQKLYTKLRNNNNSMLSEYLERELNDTIELLQRSL